MLAAGVRLAGKVALVTGAGSGIGRAVALRFAREGARVACADRVVEAARDTARAIAEAGGQSLALAVDVTDPAGCERAVRETLEAFGGLTTLVNAVGASHPASHRGPPPR